MATINWTDEDLVDPYPAILETLEKVFAFAYDLGNDTTPDPPGILGTSEAEIIQELHIAAMTRLQELDSASVPILKGQA